MWAKIATSAVIFIPITFYQFIVNFLNLRKEKKILILLYTWSIVELILLFTTNLVIKDVKLFSYGYFGIGGYALWIHSIIYPILLIRIITALLAELKKKDIAINRHNQVKYLLIGFIFALIGGVDFVCTYGIAVYPIGYIMAFALLLILAYTIVRHQLLEIEVIIKRTLVFAGLLASVFATLVLPTLIIQEYIFRGAGVGGRMLGLTISGIIIILALRRIENFLMNITDKYLFQKKYDYKELLKTFTGEVLTVLDLERLVRLTVDKLSSIIKITSCGILLLNNEKNRYELIASQGIDKKNLILESDNTLASFLTRTKSYLSVKHQGKDSRLPPRIVEDMNKLKLELAIPLVIHKEMTGILTLGKKKSDEDYTQDDMDILLPLARTLAIAISNAEMFVELGKTQAEAAQREKMAVIGTLSAGINHEICNPLGIARGQCEAFILNIKDGLYKNKTPQELFEKAQQIMEKVIHETDRATAITKRLSSFAKPSKGIISDDVSIKDEIDEVLALVGYELKLDKIDIIKDIDENLPLIAADKKQLQEVFFNLIRNAAQAIEEKGKVTIRARKEDDKVIVDIEDTGQGIPEDKLAEIFNPFYTTKEPGKGTGLGLFIVRQVVERNKGRISVKSKVNEGTTFTLEFPVATKEKVK